MSRENSHKLKRGHFVVMVIVPKAHLVKISVFMGLFRRFSAPKSVHQIETIGVDHHLPECGAAGGDGGSLCERKM
jgi:hypothetical protein